MENAFQTYMRRAWESFDLAKNIEVNPKAVAILFQNFVDLTCHVSSAFTVIPQQQINRDKANDIKCERRRRQELLVIRA